MPDVDDQQSLLCTSYQKKIAYVLSRSLVTEDDVSSLLRGFFKDFLGLTFSFTMQELKGEMDKKFIAASLKEEICAFLDEYTTEQFSAPQQLTQERLKQYLERFSILIDALNPRQDKRAEPSIARLAQKLMAITAVKTQTTKPATEQPSVPVMRPEVELTRMQDIKPAAGMRVQQTPALANAPSIETQPPAVERIHVLLEKAYAALENDKHAQARKHYKEALKAYNALPVSEQSQCYLAIESLYRTLT
jgi:hypothetical protein